MGLKLAVVSPECLVAVVPTPLWVLLEGVLGSIARHSIADCIQSPTDETWDFLGFWHVCSVVVTLLCSVWARCVSAAQAPRQGSLGKRAACF